MRIGEIASAAEVSIQTLRYYERRGLLPVPRRQPSGYRRYDAEAVRRVRFIRRAQHLGFTLQEIRDLLGFWTESIESCSVVEQRATVTLERIDEQIRDLKRIRGALGKYVNACRQHEHLESCPLLRALGDGGSTHG